jgi:muramoyltetrapeptide carboxypeptidase LdcA involved in peptidoglycan recycling
MGFKVLNQRFVTRLPSDKRKTEQIHSAFLDKRADLILAQRGGYSSLKLLPLLDFELIRKNPKVLRWGVAGVTAVGAFAVPPFGGQQPSL